MRAIVRIVRIVRGIWGVEVFVKIVRGISGGWWGYKTSLYQSTETYILEEL